MKLSRICAITALVSVATSVFAGAGNAGEQNAVSSHSAQYRLEEIAIETAPITTREDLERYLAEKSPRNPLNLLSDEARRRLQDTLIVNAAGKISSMWIADIKSELSPSQAAQVFALFGQSYLASDINNGTESSALDKAVKDSKSSRIHPSLTGYYCNAWLCQTNEFMNCVVKSCKWPE